jgi:hypothetical protein
VLSLEQAAALQSVWQLLLRQTAPGGHECPQAPQLSASEETSLQLRLQQTPVPPSGRGQRSFGFWEEPQSLAVVHTPDAQNVPAGQRTPQPPQLSGSSRSVARHDPPQQKPLAQKVSFEAVEQSETTHPRL